MKLIKIKLNTIPPYKWINHFEPNEKSWFWITLREWVKILSLRIKWFVYKRQFPKNTKNPNSHGTIPKTHIQLSSEPIRQIPILEKSSNGGISDEMDDQAAYTCASDLGRKLLCDGLKWVESGFIKNQSYREVIKSWIAPWYNTGII